MKILGIDTTACSCSVGLVCDGKVVVKETLVGGPTHSQTLLPFVRKVLSDADTPLKELDLIAVANGPGSFTGLRIGISTVKGLAFLEDIPCLGVSTPEGLAMNAVSFEGSYVVSVMDARRGEFYNAIFRIENGFPTRLCEDRAIAGEALKEECQKLSPLIILGDGAEKFVEMFPEHSENLADEEIRFQSGASVALLAERYHSKDTVVNCNDLAPAYLRLPQAEREWLKNNKDKKEILK